MTNFFGHDLTMTKINIMKNSQSKLYSDLQAEERQSTSARLFLYMSNTVNTHTDTELYISCVKTLFFKKTNTTN